MLLRGMEQELRKDESGLNSKVAYLNFDDVTKLEQTRLPPNCSEN